VTRLCNQDLSHTYILLTCKENGFVTAHVSERFILYFKNGETLLLRATIYLNLCDARLVEGISVRRI
jgi:hypothetical protein